MSKNYKCKNSSAGVTPYIEYSGNCTLLNDGSGNWRIKFTTSGTVKFNTSMSIDIFLVGGGGGGSDNGGGGGGYTKTYKSQVISTGSYAVNVGSGGGAGSNGGASCNGGSCGSAKANTGGGGGGYYNAATSGGSGIVIIRNKR